LIKSGAFDFTGVQRRTLLERYGNYRYMHGLDSVKPVQQINKTHIHKLLDAGIIKPHEQDDREFCLNLFNKWREKQYQQEWQETVMAGDEFKWEFETLSYMLIGNPFKDIDLPTWDSYENGDKETKIGGTIIAIKKTKIKKGKQAGKQMAFLNVDTLEGTRDVVVFANQWENHQEKLEKGNMVIIRGEKNDEKLVLNGVKLLNGSNT
jgi:DNA polymerase III alpha subunit